MNEKLTGTSYFVRDARRVDDIRCYRRECIKKRREGKRYMVEKIIELESIDYENFCEDLLVSREFIEENLGLMFVDKKNVWHCLLVTEVGKPDTGVLVESKKMGFPMYTALYQKCSDIKTF